MSGFITSIFSNILILFSDGYDTFIKGKEHSLTHQYKKVGCIPIK